VRNVPVSGFKGGFGTGAMDRRFGLRISYVPVSGFNGGFSFGVMPRSFQRRLGRIWSTSQAKAKPTAPEREGKAAEPGFARLRSLMRVDSGQEGGLVGGTGCSAHG
jgi:hypothetical protein